MARKRSRHVRAARTLQRAVRHCQWNWRHRRKLRLATRGQVPGVVRCTVLRARGLALAPGCEAYVKVSILGDVGLDDDVYSGPPVLVAARTKWVDGGGRDPDWQARHGNALALPWEGASSPATQRDAMDATPFEIWLEVWGCRAAVAGSGDDVFVGAAMVSLTSAVGRAPRTPRTPAQQARGAREWVELYDTHGASTGMVQLSLAFIMEADAAEKRASARRRGGSENGSFVGGALAKKIMSATRVAKRRGLFVQATPQVKSAARAVQRARRRCVDRRVAVRDRQLDRPLQQGDVGEVLLSVLALRGLPHRTSHSVSVKVTALGLTSWTREKEQTSCTRWGSTPDLVVLPWSTRVVDPVAPGRRSSCSAAAAAKQGGAEAWTFKSKDTGAAAEERGSDSGAPGASGAGESKATDEHDGGRAAAAANERAREFGGREIDIAVWSRCGGGDNQLIGRASMWLDHSGSIPMLVRDESAPAPSLASLALLGEEGSKAKHSKAGGRARGKAGGKPAGAAAVQAPRQKRKKVAAGKAMPRFRRPAAWLKRKALLVRNDEGRVCCEIDVAVAAARSAWRLDYTRPKRAAHKRDIAAASKAPKLGVQRSLTDEEEEDLIKEPTSRRALQRGYAIRTSVAAMRWQPGVLRLFIQRIDGVWFASPRTQPCVQVHARLVSGRGLHADIVEGWSTSALVPIDAAASSAVSAARSREVHGDVFGDGGSTELSFDVDTVLLLEHDAAAVRRLRATREPCVVQIELTVEDERTVSRERNVIARCNVVIGGAMMSTMTWHALDGENASDGSIAGGALVRKSPLHQLISALTCETGRILLAAEFVGADAAASKSTPATAPTPEERAAADSPPEPTAPPPFAALVAEPTGPLVVPQTASLIVYALVARPLMLPGDFGQRAVSPSRRLRGDAAAAAEAALRAPPRAAPERLVLRATLAPGPARSHDKESAAGQTLASLHPGVSAASPQPNPLDSDASSVSSDDDESGNYEWDPLTRCPIRIHWGEKLHALGVMDDPATRTMWRPAASSTVRLKLHDAASLDDGYDGDVVAFVDVPLETLSNGAAVRVARSSAQSDAALAEGGAISMSLPFQQRWVQFEAVDGGVPMQVLLSSAMLTGEGRRHHGSSQDGTPAGEEAGEARGESEEEVGDAVEGGDALARGGAVAGTAADAGAVAEAGLLDIRIHALRGVSGLAKRPHGHGREDEHDGSGVPEDLLIQLTMWPHPVAAPVLYMTDVSGPSRISSGGGWRRWEEKICLPVVDRYASVLRAVVVSKSLRCVDKGVAQIDIPVGKIATRSAFRHWFPLHLQRNDGDDSCGAEGGGAEGGGAKAKRAQRKRRRTAADETPEIELSVRFISLGDARAWASAAAHAAQLRATSSPSADRALLRAQADYLALSVVPPRIQGVLRVMVPRSATIVLGLAPELKEQRSAALPPLVQSRTATSSMAGSPAASSSAAAAAAGGDLASVCELFEIAVLETWIARTVASGRVPTLSVMQLQGSRRYTTTLCIVSMLRQPGSVFERVVDLHAARSGNGKAKGRRAVQLPLAIQFIASTSGKDRSVSLAAGVRHCTDRRSFNLLARGVRQPKQEAQVTLNCIRARELPRVSRAQDPMVVARLIVSNVFGRTLPASRTALAAGAGGGGGGAASAAARAAHAAHSPEWGDGDALSLSAADVDTEILELTVLDKGTSAVIGIAEIPLANFAKHSSGGDDSDCARAWIPLHRRTASTVRPIFASEPWMCGEILVDFSLRAKYASSWTPPPLAATRHHHHHHRSRSPRHSVGGEHGAAAPFGLLRVVATVSAEAPPPDDDDDALGDRARSNETFALRLALTQGQWAESSSYFGRFDADGACVADVVAPLSGGPSGVHKGGVYSGSLRVTLVRCVGSGGGSAPGTPGMKRSARQNESVTVVESREIDVAPFTLMSGQPALLRVSLDGIDVDLRLEHYRAESDRWSAPVSTAAVMTPGQLHVVVVGAQGLPAFLSDTSVELTLHMHGQLDLCFEGATDPTKAHITKDDATATVRGWGFDALLDYAVAPSISAHKCGYADDVDVGRSRATPAEVQSLLTPLLEVRVLCSEGEGEGGGTGGGGRADAVRELGRAVFPLFSCITRSGHLVAIDLPLYKAPVASAPRGSLGGGASAGVKRRASRLAQRGGTSSRASKQHAAKTAESPARGSKKPRDSSSREKSSDAVRLALQFIPKDSAAWLGDLVATESVAANFVGSRRASSGSAEHGVRSRSLSARSVTPQGGAALASSTSTNASSSGARRGARGVHLAKSHRRELDVAARQLQETSFDSTLSVTVVEVSGVGLKRCAIGGSRGEGDVATAATCAVSLWTGHAAFPGTPAVASCADSSATRCAPFRSGWRGGGRAQWSHALNFNMPPLWKTTDGGLVLCNFELRVAVTLVTGEDRGGNGAEKNVVAVCELQLPLRVVQPTGRAVSGLLDTWVALRSPLDGTSMGRVHLQVLRQMADDGEATGAAPFRLPPVPGQREVTPTGAGDDNPDQEVLILSIEEFAYATAEAEASADPIVVQIKGETANAISRHAFLTPSDAARDALLALQRRRRSAEGPAAWSAEEVWNTVQWEGAAGEIMLPLPESLDFHGGADDAEEQGALAWTLRIFRIASAAPSAHVTSRCSDASTAEHRSAVLRAAATAQPELLATATLEISTTAAKSSASDKLFNGTLECTVRGHAANGSGEIVDATVRLACRRAVIPNQSQLSVTSVSMASVGAVAAAGVEGAAAGGVAANPLSTLALRFGFLPSGTEWTTSAAPHGCDAWQWGAEAGRIACSGSSLVAGVNASPRCVVALVALPAAGCAAPDAAEGAGEARGPETRARSGAAARMLEEVIATGEVSLLHEFATSAAAPATTRVIALTLRRAGSAGSAGAPCVTVRFTLDASHDGEVFTRSMVRANLSSASSMLAMSVVAQGGQDAGSTRCAWLATLKALFYQAAAQNNATGGGHFSAKRTDVRSRLVALTPGRGAGSAATSADPSVRGSPRGNSPMASKRKPSASGAGHGASSASKAGAGGGSKAIGWAQWCATVMPKLNVLQHPSHWHGMCPVFHAMLLCDVGGGAAAAREVEDEVDLAR